MTLASIFLSMMVSAFAAGDGVCVSNKDVVSHAEPRASAKTVATFSKYTALKLTGKAKKPWVEVEEYDGRLSWVPRNSLSSRLNCVVVRVDKSRLRKGPGEDFPAENLAQRGEGFLNLGGEDGWIQVQSSTGQKSWLNMEHSWHPTYKTRMSFTGDE